MCVLLWSWATDRVDLKGCLNEVYSQCHLRRERFKWCVCEKPFSHVWAEDFEHMNCCHSHAHFSVRLICCYPFSSYVLIDDHGWRSFLLLEWLKWVDNVLHNVSDMTLIEFLMVMTMVCDCLNRCWKVPSASGWCSKRLQSSWDSFFTSWFILWFS